MAHGWLRRAAAAAGCGLRARMRFQTLRSRSWGGAGEGLSPRPRLLLLGRRRLGEGRPALAPHRSYTRASKPHTHSDVSARARAHTPHCRALLPWPAEPWSPLCLRISRLSGVAKAPDFASAPPWSAGSGYRWVWPLPLGWGLLLTVQYLKLLGCHLPLGKPVAPGHGDAPAPAQRSREGTQQMLGVRAACPSPHPAAGGPRWRQLCQRSLSLSNRPGVQ